MDRRTFLIYAAGIAAGLVEKVRIKTSAPRRRGTDEPGAGGPLAELTELVAVTVAV